MSGKSCARFRLAFGLLLLALFAAHVIAADARSELILTGTVVDTAGTPVAKATVTAERGTSRQQITTDAKGAFEFSIPAVGAGGMYAALSAESPDGQLGTLSVRQEKPEPVQLVVKPGRELAVMVQDATGQALANADVVFVSEYRRLAGGATDAAGQWSGRVPADAKDWTIVALKGGVGFDYATASRSRGSVADLHPLPDQVTLKLDGARKFKVKVVDRDNRPVAGVQVGTWLVQKPGYEAEINLSMLALNSPVTGDDGIATIDWLPAHVARSWSIVYVAENQYALEHAFFIPANEPAEEVTINLLPIEELSGRVTHADGRPAEGILVSAQGKGGGSNDCRTAARTDADGRYKLQAFSEQAYVIAIAEKDWTAPYRADVVVRAGQPVSDVDFVLIKPTRVHGRVTMGSGEQPAAKARLSAVIDKGQIPAELRRKEDRIYRPISMYFYAQADDEGHYEFLLGPGEYRLQGPPRTQTVPITIPADGNQTDIVRDFKMPRPETGPLTVRVVDREGKPMAGATLSGTYASGQSVRLFTSVKTDAQGTFKTERSLDPLVLHAITADKQLAGVMRSDAEATQAEVVVGPLATASGRLLNLDGQPVPQKQLSYSIRVFQESAERKIWTNSFGGKVTTDADGRFAFSNLVPSQLYEATIQIDEHSSRGVASVRPMSPEPVDLGDVKADTEPTKHYVPPTPAERTAEAFAARPKMAPRERLDRVLAAAGREYTRSLILLGSPSDKACIDLFRLFDERADAAEKTAKAAPTPADLRWEFELLSLDVARPGVRELASQLGIPGEKPEPMLAVLSSDGQLAATFPLQMTGDKLDSRAVGSFLATHKLPTRDADKLLTDGLRRAQAEDKRLFFIFSASWCGPCRSLAEFLSQHKTELDQHYVFVKLDVSRDERAEALRQRYKESKSGGVPWYTILDAQGTSLVTSNAPAEPDDPGNSNIGFPSEPKGIEHFMHMLQATAPRLSVEKLAEIRTALLKGE